MTTRTPTTTTCSTPSCGYVEKTQPKTTAKSFFMKWGWTIFILVNVLVLYILHFTHNTPISNIFTDVPEESRSTVVGYAANGNLEKGAGTSIYLNQGEFPSEKIEFVSMGRIGSTNLCMFKRDETSFISTFNTPQQHSHAKFSNEKAISKGHPQGLVALSSTRGVALFRSLAYDGHLVPVIVGQENQVSVDESQNIKFAPASYQSFVSRLSDDHFITTNYADCIKFERCDHQVQVGKVNENGQITMVASDILHDHGKNGKHYEFSEATAIANDKFVVPWFISNSTEDSGLCVSAFVFKQNDVKRVDVTCSDIHHPAYHVTSIKMSDNTAAIAFYDAKNNFAMTLATIEMSSSNQKLRFRSSIVVDPSTGDFDFGTGQFWYPLPRLEMLENGNLAIAFQHAANSGRPVVHIYRVNAIHDLESVSRSIPVSSGKYQIQGDKTHNFISLDLLSVSESDLVVSVVHGNVKELTLIEMKSDPVGIVASDDMSKVSLTGFVKPGMELQQGRIYFGTSGGELVADPETRHLNGGRSASDVIRINDDLYVTYGSRVGVAMNNQVLRLDNF